MWVSGRAARLIAVLVLGGLAVLLVASIGQPPDVEAGSGHEHGGVDPLSAALLGLDVLAVLLVGGLLLRPRRRPAPADRPSAPQEMRPAPVRADHDDSASEGGAAPVSPALPPEGDHHVPASPRLPLR